jgi:hypothetical protein
MLTYQMHTQHQLVKRGGAISKAIVVTASESVPLQPSIPA